MTTHELLNQLEATSEYLADVQKAIIVENSGIAKDPARLALRFGLAGWILNEADNTQLLEIVDKYKTSPRN